MTASPCPRLNIVAPVFFFLGPCFAQRIFAAAKRNKPI